MTQLSPARRALPWLYWMLFFVVVANVPAFNNGLANLIARLLVTGLVFGGGVYLIAYLIYALTAKKA